MAKSKTILVAPLNWGLGHASRCIPVIRALLSRSFNVIIASDGGSLSLLRKEFPKLPFIEVPSYNIRYPKNGKMFKWKMLSQLPLATKTMYSEKKIIDKLVSEATIDGIISDNRPGIRDSRVPSVYLTHQLNVLSGSTSVFSSKLHWSIIDKFDECWVPDTPGPENLSGLLGHPKKMSPRIKYAGILSRMANKILPKKYDILAIISGPEPQRSLLEKKLIDVLSTSELKTMIVKGIVENEQKLIQSGNLTIVNFMDSTALEKSISESELIISRSGYSSLMDLSEMEKQVFFIPTPGQYEQEYLAKRMEELGNAPFCDQSEFSLDRLSEVKNYSGLKKLEATVSLEALFDLFEGE